MTVDEKNLRAASMNVRLDVVLLRHRGEASIVEKPDCFRGLRERAKPDLISSTRVIHMLI